MESQIQEIKLIQLKQETNNVYTFTFENQKNISWKSGQYAIFTFPNLKTKERNSRAFSICSSEKEDCIMISTKINTQASDFKTHLKSMKTNDKIEIKIPLGEFTLSKDSTNILAIAGGIGITPFRAILYDIANNQSLKNIKFTLIYSEKDKNYAYKKELDQFAQQDNIEIKYLSTIQDTDKEIITYINKHKNNSEYFISGPPIMVESIKQLLHKNGIEKIKNDSFYGY